MKSRPGQQACSTIGVFDKGRAESATLTPNQRQRQIRQRATLPQLAKNSLQN